MQFNESENLVKTEDIMSAMIADGESMEDLPVRSSIDSLSQTNEKIIECYNNVGQTQSPDLGHFVDAIIKSTSIMQKLKTLARTIKIPYLKLLMTSEI